MSAPAAPQPPQPRARRPGAAGRPPECRPAAAAAAIRRRPLDEFDARVPNWEPFVKGHSEEGFTHVRTGRLDPPPRPEWRRARARAAAACY